MRTARRPLPLVALALAVLAGCSSAPLPTSTLGQQYGQPGLQQADGSASGQAAPGQPGTAASGPAQGGRSAGTATAGVGADGAVQTSAGGAQAASGGGASSTGGTSSSGATASAPHSTLFTPAEDRIGISDKQINLCMHAALTYGKAFNTEEKDFNVFWQALNDEKGGIHGRKVVVTYENDNYTPDQAVQAATACKATKPFILLGGIGFDQIPAVRNWAEQNHQLYLYHTATVKGSEHLRYSFTELPTVERTGEAFAQLAGTKYRGKKVGIIERDSANWAPGVAAFKAVASKYGITVVADQKVAQNKGNYTDDLLAMKNAGAQVVWIWLNALESTQVLKQAKVQGYNPHWLLFPFNLTSQTLDSDAMNPPLDGVAMFPAYSNHDYSGPFSSYADDMKEFERQYAKYDPNADLSGVGGDLLFLAWTEFKALAVQLDVCGRDCTRNTFVDVLEQWKGRPSSSSCDVDFSHDPHHGSDQLNFMTTYRAPDGKVNWRITTMCVGPDGAG